MGLHEIDRIVIILLKFHCNSSNLFLFYLLPSGLWPSHSRSFDILCLGSQNLETLLKSLFSTYPCSLNMNSDPTDEYLFKRQHKMMLSA